MKFFSKIPAGLMVIPLLLGSIINTFIPGALAIGGLTTALFSSAGSSTALGIQLFCLGTTLNVKDMPTVIKRGGVLLIAKFAIGTIIGIAIGKFFGFAGFLGLTSLSVISAVTNDNGSIFLTLMAEYGDEKDVACMPLLAAINDGPFLTLVALGASGLASIPFMALVAAIIPTALGMLLGNIDKSFKEFFAPMGTAIIPLIGFMLGAGINLGNIFAGGISGVLLGLITVFIGGGFILIFDRFVSKRPGYAAWGVSTTAGNAVAVPAAVALVDPSWTNYVGDATAQVAASVVLSAILVPIVTSWWVKKFGSPKKPKEGLAL